MKWAVCKWIEGEVVTPSNIADLAMFARDVAAFLNALQRIDAADGLLPSAHNFYRGGALETYDSQVREAIIILQEKIDAGTATDIWETAVASEYRNRPVWIHGDVSLGNLLVRDGVLCAVIDFGNMDVGDPACDLVIAWNVFDEKSRAVFCDTLRVDPATWARGRGWSLWKALIIEAGLSLTNAIEFDQPRRIIDAVIVDHRNREN